MGMLLLCVSLIGCWGIAGCVVAMDNPEKEGALEACSVILADKPELKKEGALKAGSVILADKPELKKESTLKAGSVISADKSELEEESTLKAGSVISADKSELEEESDSKSSSVEEKHRLLVSAILKGNINGVNAILHEAKDREQLMDILAKADERGVTALMLAAVLGNEKLVGAILGIALDEDLDAIAMLFATDHENKCNSLEWAIDRKNPLAVIYMLIAARENGGLEHVLTRTYSNGHTLLTQAIASGSTEVVRCMLNVILNEGPKVAMRILSAPDGWGYFHLLEAIKVDNSADAVMFRMIFNAMNTCNPNRLNEVLLQEYKGKTLFDIAVLKKNYTILETLVRATPSNWDTVNRLLRGGSSRSDILLTLAVREGNTAVIDSLFVKIGEGYRIMDKFSSSIVKDLLKEKMTIGRYSGCTLLTYALETCNFNVARSFLQELESLDVGDIGEVIASQSCCNENETFWGALCKKQVYLWAESGREQLDKWSGILQNAFLNSFDNLNFERATQLIKASKGVVKKISIEDGCSPLHMVARKICDYARSGGSDNSERISMILQLEELAEALIDDGCVFLELENGEERKGSARHILSSIINSEELDSVERARIEGIIERLATHQLKKTQ